MIISLVFGFMLGAAAIVFALQNTGVVALRFMSYEFETSLALLSILAVGVGILISLLVSIPSVVDNAIQVMSLKNQNKKLAEEVEDHRQAAATVVVTEPSAILDARNL